MAGNYPDPPGLRLPYDKDGTVGVVVNTAMDAILKSLPAADLAKMNDDDGDAPTASNMYGVTLIFPTLRTITHTYVNWNSGNPLTPFCQSSVDTTNGIDGTWVTVTGPINNNVNSFSKIGARTPTAVTAGATGIKAIRFRDQFGNRDLAALHLYGYATTPGDRLEFWHPTLDQPLRQTPGLTDWGNRPRSTSATKQFRVKNHSPGLTASSIVVGIDELSPASPTLASMTQVRYNGGAYGATAAIASLGPGAVSEIIEVKQDLTASAVMGLWTQRLSAVAGSWA